MNKHSFRTIFNSKRGMLMAVSEAATSNGKSAKGEGSNEGGSSLGAAIGAMLLAALPLTGIAQIIADPSAPRSQQAVILPAGNGVPIVNIQTPTAGGVSMNMFSQFNVNNNGAILNNGRLNTQTQLAGWIQANPHLATGAASVIVNQVNSNNPTLLNGFIEVAGQRAQVIIANPSGIQVNGAGFINAQSATLTTGTPNFNGNVITGYTVNQGTVQINGAGLDASTTDYTAILARAVQINAGIWAKNLDVVAGANQINVSSPATTPTGISAATPTGTTPFFAIDVSSLGGMYAGKIMLIGTEAGLGFKNTGTIMGTNASLYAGAGEVTISVDGILSNSGRIQSDAGMTTTLGTTLVGGAATGGLQNTGTIYASGNNAITTNGDISNTATIAAQGNLTITANGANSNIQSSSTSILAAGMSTAGVLSAPSASTGNLQVSSTQSITANGQNLAAQNLSLAAQTINLSGSTTYAGNSMNLAVSTGSLILDNTNLVAGNIMALSTPTLLSTKNSNVSAAQINLKANDWDNTAGNVTHTGTGDLTVNLVGNITNAQGKIQANAAHTNLTTANLNNTDGLIAGQAVNIVTSATNAQTLTNTNGTIYAKQDLTVSSGAIGNDKGLIQAAGNVSIDTHHAALLNTHSGTSAGLVSGGNLTVQSGVLDNTAGFIASTGNLSIATTDSAGAGVLINNTNGIINAAQNTNVFAGNINNTQGQIQSQQSTVLNVTGGQITNNLGLIRTAKDLTITTATLDNSNTQGTNQGIEAANISMGVATLNNTLGAVRASMGTGLAANLNIAGSSLVNNNQGLLSSSGRVNITDTGTALAVTSVGGKIVANGDATLTAATLDNTNGALVAQNVSLTTQALTTQTLTNTNGTIYGRGDVTVSSGAIGNDKGIVQADGNLGINTHGAALTNTNAGTTGGLVAGNNLTVQSGAIDNSAGYLAATGNLTVIAPSLNNTNGQIQTNGNSNLAIAGTLTNSQGLIRSASGLTITATTLDNSNSQGTNQGIEGANISITAPTINNNLGAIKANMSAGAAASLTLTSGGTLNNTNGILSSTGSLTVADTVASNASNNLAKTLAITNTGGSISAGKLLTVDAATLSGDGKLTSLGDLTLKLVGAHTNSATGELVSSGNSNITVSGLLTNRGLIDGVNTTITAGDVTNLGTGRIYGDNIAIATNTLTNTAETVGGTTTAATIAARNRLDIGATNVLNSEHGLIFSDGDINIGGSLDANRQATGSAQLVRNGSATIDASGNININAGTITNANDHFAYSIQLVNTVTGIREDPYANYYRIFDRFTYEPVVTQNAPSVITAGGSISLTGTTITNQQSKIIAGGALTATGTTINNTQITDQRRVNDVGTQWSWGVTGGHDSCWPCHWVLDWGMVPSTYNVNAYTTLPVSGGVTQTATSPNSAAAQALETTFVSTTVANALSLGSRPLFSAIAAIPDTQNTLLKAFNNGQTAQATQTASGAAFTKVTNSSFTKGTPAITVPNNSLFRTPSNINATYLVETDPKFANYKKWLSSDYLLTALSFDPVTQQKRLGDGFYEQRLIREQVATLTGQRFLAGYQSEEEEYRALMDNAITVAKQFNLRPGIALSEEQVAQLTSDIVWLVEKDVLLPNGTTVKALVPQVYAKLRNGDLQADGKLLGGSLLSGNSVNLEASGNITNGGTILGRKLVSLTADNINNSNAILGSTVALTSKTDINNTGGNITAKDALLIDAGRDLNVVTNTNTTTAGARTATTLDRVAGLYVTSPTGILVANAGNNINLTAAQIKSAGSAQFQTTNGTINLGAATTGESMRFGSTGEATFHQNLAQSQQTGTSIQTGGNLTMAAGNSITGVGASLQSNGTVNLGANGNIVLSEGRTTKSEDLAWVATSTDFLSKTTTATRIQSSSSTATGNTISGAGGVNMQAAGGTLLLSAANVTSTGGNVSLSGADVVITSALNSQSNSFEQESKKSGIGLSDITGTMKLGQGLNHQKKENEDAGDTSLAQTSLTGQNVQVTSTAGNVSLRAVALTATGTSSASGNTTGTVALNAGNGTVNLQTLQTTAYQSKSVEESDVVWQSAKGSGSQNQNTNYNQINGNLSVTASRVNIEGTGATLAQTAQTLASQPGMGYLNQLVNDPALRGKIDWKKIDELHKTWDYDKQGLSKAGAAVLAIVVTYFTAGAGSGSAAALGMTTTTATGAVVATTAGAALNAAVSAAISSLASTAAVSMVNNGGDISKTLNDLGSSSNVRALLTSMVTAGTLTALPNILPTGWVDPSTMAATSSSTFGAQLTKNLINSAATAVVNSAINGTSLEDNLKNGIVSALINTGAAQGANAIGTAATGTLGTPAQLNEFAQLFAHAALGCAVGAAKTSGASGGGGCSAGAIGAVVGELAAKTFDPDATGTAPGGGSTQSFAGMMAAIAVAAAGGNPAQINIAAASATNAVENNYLQTQTLKNALNKLSNCTGFACEAVKTNLKNTGFGGDQKSIEQLADKCRVTGCADDIKDIMNAATMLLTPEAKALLGEKDAALLYNKQMADLGKALEASAAGAATFEQRQNVVKVGLALAGTALGGAAVAVVGRTVLTACASGWTTPGCFAMMTDVSFAMTEAFAGVPMVGVFPSLGLGATALSQRLSSAGQLGSQALAAEMKIIENEMVLLGRANQTYNSQSSQAIRAWDKHDFTRAGGTGTYPVLTGGYDEKMEVINAWLRELARNPDLVITKLGRGGTQYSLPSGKGVRINADGTFNLID